MPFQEFLLVLGSVAHSVWTTISEAARVVFCTVVEMLS